MIDDAMVIRLDDAANEVLLRIDSSGKFADELYSLMRDSVEKQLDNKTKVKQIITFVNTVLKHY